MLLFGPFEQNRIIGFSFCSCAVSDDIVWMQNKPTKCTRIGRSVVIGATIPLAASIAAGTIPIDLVAMAVVEMRRID